jgi:hypothetical protein
LGEQQIFNLILLGMLPYHKLESFDLVTLFKENIKLAAEKYRNIFDSNTLHLYGHAPPNKII